MTASVRPAGSSLEDPVAVPFADLESAITTALDCLASTGAGRWTLLDGSDRDDDATVVPLAVPDTIGRLVLAGPVAVDSLPVHVRHAVLSTARLIATLVANDSQLARLHERATRAEQESATDALTGLPNNRTWWRALVREAARCDRHGLSAVIAVVDLDDLKLVNDTAGHLAGDVLLRSVAHALTDAVRIDDMVARLGGDEFGVLAVDPDHALGARLVERLADSLGDVGARASIGVARYGPGGRIDDTFDEADRAMYDAKRARRRTRP